MTGMMTGIPNCSGPERDRRNRRRITWWSLAWALPFVVVVHGFTYGWIPEGWTRLLIVALVAVPSVMTALAYRRFIREADELRRKIELDALALAFTVGVIVGLVYFLLQVAGFVETAEIDHVIILMLLAYPIGSILGSRRYA